MKKMMLMVVMVVVMAVLFVGSMAWAGEISERRAELQKFIVSLNELEKGCPYSLSEELFLNDMLQDLVERFEVLVVNPSLPKEDVPQVLAIKIRIEGILNGPCCQTIRSIEKVQEMLFDLQKDFKTPSNQKWWESTKDDWRN